MACFLKRQALLGVARSVLHGLILSPLLCSSQVGHSYWEEVGNSWKVIKYGGKLNGSHVLSDFNPEGLEPQMIGDQSSEEWEEMLWFKTAVRGSHPENGWVFTSNVSLWSFRTTVRILNCPNSPGRLTCDAPQKWKKTRCTSFKSLQAVLFTTRKNIQSQMSLCHILSLLHRAFLSALEGSGAIPL